MKNALKKIHPAGHQIVLRFLLILLLVNSALGFLLKGYITLKIVIGVVSLLSFTGVAMFFRKPDRKVVDAADNLVICPADGTIVVVEEVMESEYFKEMRKQVSIFMSITNVHINWYPIAGMVEYVKYHAGKYLVAWHPKSSEENERNTIVLKGSKGDVLVRQVAGFVARKIVSYAHMDKEVVLGDQIGMIKFGSRVDLYLPLDAEINVELDQKVRGGQTIIGKFSK